MLAYIVGLLDPATWFVLAGLPFGIASYFLLPADVSPGGLPEQADAD